MLRESIDNIMDGCGKSIDDVGEPFCQEPGGSDTLRVGLP